ncbi:FAD binding domain-containing protein [Meiothermus granaticius]|uniref:Carbon monoxide dehydrogenase medium chain n=1 Tax=Meiothermus granaticius NBRC 107808 TaxID=1227551 RepID=A0A399F5S4_9DEIN|nr:xanthine dehydrogenase family protein subunit M [Meiothermus granaticius]MCL6525757.1 xanthine dehydrogenase family protein subunit M [Thermaceae bacterium]RIH90996.1 Carbon monoxide dehydrogenase medium chain [Meiothermus granaticius NBRC 107808]GEM85513.1 carbon monoxide dehydrogenase medium subunit [Meiothermus granaticius NBRC 107808]
MIPGAFEYHRPTSLEEAVALMGQHGFEARVLAGGQSLIPAMRYRLAQPAVLVDINRLPGLNQLSEEGGMLRVGALVRDTDVEFNSGIQSRYALIADVSRVVADPIVRFRGTVVGSLCHNDPAGDWTAAALASRAQVVIRGPAGERTEAIDDFLVDSFTTSIGEGEIAVEARFPVPGPRTSGAYEKIERKVGDYATAAAAVQLELTEDGRIQEVGIGVTAVALKALRVAEGERLLRGQKPTRDLIRAAAEEAAKIADPNPDARGSKEYKRDMARVLVGRGLIKALGRLGVQL